MTTRRQVKGEAVRRELLPGTSTALLKELHLLTRAGDLNADSLRKLKQVNHLANLLAPALDDVLARFGEPVVVDCGAGKSYLGFVLYELFLKDAGKGTLLAVESRPDLARSGAERAARLAFSRLRFVESPIEAAPLPDRVHLVTALHACDTATDDALALAIRHGADHVAVVPCCQAEVARQLGDAESPAAAVAPLFEHPWHRREFGSHLTNVVRALVLEAHGYRVTVTELTGWEHSVKNELILGKKVRASSREAQARLDALLAATGVRPKLVRALAAPAA
ncbi:class I SAM-dependent methyltransferase [Anaeromyxobacter oryzae]|uniref:Methyltransferase n=1 Tax=Anaeromyxobacter oryzae TaxID=2918170 RepID=A0ABN6MSX5_9BACT|nr:SAM-dependent methyltransferase [Anaeromyxobacter oryzae]BDG04026.1 methyltransferase [Anaeromyxobacter oryzae]